MTADQSITLYSEYFDENCHSTSGAIAETDFNYIEGCEICSKITDKGSISIFEVGFGLGIGAIRTFENLKTLSGPTHFISCELDEGLVQWTKSNNTHPLISSIEKRIIGDLTIYETLLEGFRLTILIGDVRSTLSLASANNIFKKFDAIYQDAFSPKKNPCLWTTEWFSELKHLSADDCVLSTYSAAMPIRKSLLAAGWSVFKREGFGDKRSTTIAKIDVQMKPEFLSNIENSPELCLSDKLLKK